MEQLHAAPRYIQDEEWTELERVLRNSFNLSRLQFSVSEQAILLGISPASVTKARQRLKSKLKQ